MNHLRSLACLSALVFAAAAGCGSDDSGSSGASGGGSTGGTAGTGGAAGTGGTAATGGTAGSGGGETGGTAGDGGTAGQPGTGGTAGTGNGGSGGSAGAGGTGGGGTEYTISLTITDVSTQDPAEGMDVCVHGTPPAACTTTDSTGVAVVQVPTAEDVTLEYGMSGVRTHLLSIRGDYVATNPTIYTLAVNDFVASYLMQSLGVQDDPTKGHIVGLIATGAGATVAIDPSSGSGPVYASPDGLPDPNLTSTSSSGAYMFVNDPGTVSMAATQTGLSCEPEMGVVGTTPNSIVVPVEAGSFTIGTAFDCN